jgi:hypothetical protein
LEWSHGLLTDAERRVFASPYVFVGAPVMAAEAIAPAVIGEVDPITLLDDLVRKSLAPSSRVLPDLG